MWFLPWFPTLVNKRNTQLRNLESLGHHSVSPHVNIGGEAPLLKSLLERMQCDVRKLITY